MKKKKPHITEVYSERNEKNLRARRLLADFLGLDQKDCKIPLNQCSTVLLRFLSNYEEFNKEENITNSYHQESLF